MFDNPATRGQLGALYNAEQSFLSFEGQQMQGTAKIMEKLGSLSFTKIAHMITATDCHPMFDGGILVSVMGQLKTDDDPPQSFMQNFVLKPAGDSFFIQHVVLDEEGITSWLQNKVLHERLGRVIVSLELSHDTHQDPAVKHGLAVSGRGHVSNLSERQAP